MIIYPDNFVVLAHFAEPATSLALKDAQDEVLRPLHLHLSRGERSRGREGFSLGAPFRRHRRNKKDPMILHQPEEAKASFFSTLEEACQAIDSFSIFSTAALLRAILSPGKKM